MKHDPTPFVEKAHRALAAAEASITRYDAETAINRAYYAAYYMATAYVRLQGEKPRTHKGLHLLWGRHAKGHLSDELASFLAHAFQLRQRADYDAMTTFDLHAANDMVEDARRFLEAVQQMIQQP